MRRYAQALGIVLGGLASLGIVSMLLTELFRYAPVIGVIVLAVAILAMFTGIVATMLE